MREPRFRVWDKVTKRYYAVSGLEYSKSGELREIYLAGIQIDESNPIANVRKPSEVILEQYTGLKDANEKEICVGDILSAWGKYYKVVFDSERVGFVAERMDGLRDSFFGKYFGRYLVDHCEVVGNINKNPELLEEKK